MSYWRLVEPIWDTVSIYDGPEAFLEQFAAAPEVSRTLFAAHWCQSEIDNGGLCQFFCNSTGVLAPEAVDAFRRLGMPMTAQMLERAMAFFGPEYPRDRGEREELLDAAYDEHGEAWPGPFHKEGAALSDLLESENGGFRTAADRYAEEAAPRMG